jgi:hypothetical protein
MAITNISQSNVSYCHLKTILRLQKIDSLKALVLVLVGKTTNWWKCNNFFGPSKIYAEHL